MSWPGSPDGRPGRGARAVSRLRIVLGDGSLARYLQGGGHWAVWLQHLLGLLALGHDVYLMELLWSSGDEAADERRIASFFVRLGEYGLADRCVLLFYREDRPPDLASAITYGRTRSETEDIIRTADMLWNYCGGVLDPLLSEFRHRVLVDLDPGHLQAAALSVDIPTLRAHEAYLTVGAKVGDADCPVPTLGYVWRRFTPFVYLPMWPEEPPPAPTAPLTSVTNWTWGGDMPWRGGLVSVSKRDAYLRYLDLPRRAGRSFELAANIRPEDTTGDRELLQTHGWNVVDPWDVAGSPAAYRRYVVASRGEILCPKPIFIHLRTGWFSDRSACYLATGRPVLMEETGVGAALPTGMGLLTFSDVAEAVERVAEIDRDYAAHARAARDLARAYLDSGPVLEGMLAACSG